MIWNLFIFVLAIARNCARVVFGVLQRLFILHYSPLFYPLGVVFSRQKVAYVHFLNLVYILAKIYHNQLSRLGMKRKQTDRLTFRLILL